MRFSNVFVVTFVIGLALKATIGLRVTAEEEEAGVDQSQHSETAYSFGGGGMGSSYAEGADSAVVDPANQVPDGAPPAEREGVDTLGNR